MVWVIIMRKNYQLLLFIILFPNWLNKYDSIYNCKCFIESSSPSNVSWIGFKFSSSLPSDGKEPVKLRFVKCRWCLNDLLKSLAAITWSLVSECAEFIAHGKSGIFKKAR